MCEGVKVKVCEGVKVCKYIKVIKIHKYTNTNIQIYIYTYMYKYLHRGNTTKAKVVQLKGQRVNGIGGGVQIARNDFLPCTRVGGHSGGVPHLHQQCL